MNLFYHNFGNRAPKKKKKINKYKMYNHHLLVDVKRTGLCLSSKKTGLPDVDYEVLFIVSYNSFIMLFIP